MRSILFLLAVSTAAFATTSVVSVTSTATQLIIHVTTDQVGNCTYRISESNTLSPVVHDVDTSLFAGADSDARDGSIVDGSDHWFVAGTRTANQASDGKFYSRALSANTTQYGGVTCGGDAEVDFSQATTNILTGNTYVDPVPFDAGALGNYAVPSPDYSNPIVDPKTGLKGKFLTGPGQSPEGTNLILGTLSGTTNAGNIAGQVLASTNWTNPSNCLSIDGSFCSYSAGSGHDTLMLRMASTCGQNGSCGGDGWQFGLDGPLTGISVDTYQLSLTGNGNGSTVQVDTALSWNGVSQGTEWQTLTLPATTGSVITPAALTDLNASWLGSTYPQIPAVYWHLVQRTYTVNTVATVVTIPSGCNQFGTGGCFSLDPRVLTAGSKITIAGTEYTISSVDSATQVTLTGSAGTQIGATAYLANFGVLVRRHSTSAGTVNLDGASIKAAWSDNFGNGGTGDLVFNSPITSTDTGGTTGRMSLLPKNSGTFALFWITNEPAGRFLGRAFLPAGGSGGDAYNATQYGTSSSFDATNPNRWYAVTSLGATTHPTIIRGDYVPAGVAGCAMPADYTAIAPDSTYNPSSSDNCNITYTEVTKPSLGLDIWSQLNPVIKSGKFTCGGATVCPKLSFVQNGIAVLAATTEGGDLETWLIHVDLSTGLVVGQYSSYMNAAEGSCRACTIHATAPSNPTYSWYFNYHHDYDGGGITGAGPYQFTVTTSLTSVAGNPACAGVTDPAVTWLIPYSSGCDTITITSADSIPCDPDPSAWELANMPACSWHAGWTQWQAGKAQVGDWFLDAGATSNDRTVFAAYLGSSQWIVLRGVDVPQGPLVVPTTALFPTAHTAPWTASIQCSFSGNAFVNTAEVNGSGLLWDRRYIGFSHSVMRTPGIGGAETWGDIGFQAGISVKTGTYPSLQNQPEAYRILNNAGFDGYQGVGLQNGFGQSHPGWVASATSNMTDMSPLAPRNGGDFNLWPQPGVVTVSGTLYKIPAANAFISMNKRLRSQAVWSGMYNFQDVSGGSISGGSGDNFKWCSIDYTGATCGQAGETVGDVYMNIPSASVDGTAGHGYDYNHVNSVPIGTEVLAAVQYSWNSTLACASQAGGTCYGFALNNGLLERRLTTGGGRYNGQDTYSNAKVLEGSTILQYNCSTPGLERVQDICGALLPPAPPSEPGNSFISVPVTVGAGHAYAEVQFGYAEFGAATSFYCTTRQESCMTTTAATPFRWEGERSGTSGLEPCSSGCTIQLPALPDHAVYYRSRTSDDGTTWSDGVLQVATPSVANACSDLVLFPASHSSPAAGDSYTVTATVTDQSCVWNAASNASWLTINSGGSGTGNGTISLTAAANAGSARTGSISLDASASTHVDTQATGCSIMLAPTSGSYSAAGGSTLIAVTTSGGTCAWSTAATDGWVTFSPTTGVGSGNTTVTVAANLAGSRSSSPTVGGQTFSISQAGSTAPAVTIINGNVGVGGNVVLK